MTIRPPKMTTAKITAAEQARRQKAVDFARASVRLEGFIPDQSAEYAAARYIAGETDMAGFINAIQVSCGMEPNG